MAVSTDVNDPNFGLESDLTSPNFGLGLAQGQKEFGNIDVSNRPAVKNPDGSVSTVRTISIGTDKGETLIPTVVNGKVVSNEDAINHFKRTGENLGVFDSPDSANSFARNLHEQEANRIGLGEQPKQEGGGIAQSVISEGKALAGQAAGLLNPMNLIRGVLDIQPRSGLQEVFRTGRLLSDIVGGMPVSESVHREAPEVARQQEAIMGKYGSEAQHETLRAIGTQLGMVAAPFFHGGTAPLRETVFGKTPEVPAAPVESEAAATQAAPVAEPLSVAPGEITQAFSAKGATDVLYEKAFDALQKGETTISGVKDPLLARHKAAFDRGEINSPEDLKIAEENNAVKQTETETTQGGEIPNAESILKNETGYAEGVREEAGGENRGQNLEQAAQGNRPDSGQGSKITATAILDKKTGDVHVANPGELHPQIFNRLEKSGVPYEDLINGFEKGDLVNGFITDTGQFVDRDQARSIAGNSGQVYDWSGTKLSGESLTKEAPTVPQPEQPTETPATGVHAEALEQRPIEAPPPGETVGWEENTKNGHAWLDAGGDPQTIINKFADTGAVTPPDMGRMRAALERLQQATNVARDALRKDPGNPELERAASDAERNEQNLTDAYKPMHTFASANLASLKGQPPFTDDMATSYTALERRFRENMQRDFTPEESDKADQLTEKATKTMQDYDAKTKNLYDSAEKAYAEPKGGSRTPPTIQDLVSMFSDTVKEVCDI